VVSRRPDLVSNSAQDLHRLLILGLLLEDRNLVTLKLIVFHVHERCRPTKSLLVEVAAMYYM
jgi:hypothetical protein